MDSSLPGLDVKHQLAEDLQAMLAGLQLVVELVQGQLPHSQALLQLADQQSVVVKQQLQGGGQGLVDQPIRPVDLLAPGHHIAVVGGQGQQPHDEGLQGMVDIPVQGEGDPS